MDVSDELLDATVAVLSEEGWERLTLERVADRAGLSRVTLWRQGISRERLLEGLLERLLLDYREAMWPVLTQPGTGRERVERALKALCDVVDRNLALLLVSDSIFHRASKVRVPRSIGFNEAIERILEDGRLDGTIRYEGAPHEAANVLFNTVSGLQHANTDNWLATLNIGSRIPG